jgi:hypothetical protein
MCIWHFDIRANLEARHNCWYCISKAAQIFDEAVRGIKGNVIEGIKIVSAVSVCPHVDIMISISQILPYFVHEIFEKSNGFSGLFIATLYSGSLR